MGFRHYTVPTAGQYELTWEVAGADYKVGSALAFDNVRVNGNLLFGFESGIPGGFTPLGSVGTSGALSVTDAWESAVAVRSHARE